LPIKRENLSMAGECAVASEICRRNFLTFSVKQPNQNVYRERLSIVGQKKKVIVRQIRLVTP